MTETDELPLVTIQCLTYNHEAFIRQCLEGFVMQQTNFRFEAVVHDDASTDGTADIVREFAAKYPDIIKPIYETENQYSKHDGQLSRIMHQHTRGKYVALCEGDDYWTDPLKLQKQADFLEGNEEYSICFNDFIVVDAQSQELAENNEYLLDIGDTVNFTFDDVLNGWLFMRTPCVMYRNFGIDYYMRVKGFLGDLFCFLLNSARGKIHRIPQKMSAYRVHSGGIWSLAKKKWTNEQYVLYNRLQIEGYKSFKQHVKLNKDQLKNVNNRIAGHLRNSRFCYLGDKKVSLLRSNSWAELKFFRLHSIKDFFSCFCSLILPNIYCKYYCSKVEGKI